jgi:hypothetical protein
MTELMPLLAPEFMFTAEREKEPDTGKAWVREPTMLARPWPTSSWLGSRRCLVLAAMALAMEMASMKPTREITRAADSMAPNLSMSSLGRDTLGSPSGMLPTTSPPPASRISPLATLAIFQASPSVLTPAGAAPARCRMPSLPSASTSLSNRSLRSSFRRLALVASSTLAWERSRSAW